MRITLSLLVGLVSFGILGASPSYAGLFTLYRFVEPMSFRVGVEPELTLTSGAGLGVNAKYTHGLSDLINVQGTIGTGAGPREFRVGSALTLDIFPDLPGQPGIGVAFSGTFYRIKPPRKSGGSSDPASRENDSDVANWVGRFEALLLPYVHKSFNTGGFEFEPFLSIPVGVAFLEDSQYETMASIAFGSAFNINTSFVWVAEMGVALSHAETYVSGGVAYSY